MKINMFEILLVSMPDREKLVAEIWFDNFLLTEINQEHGNLKIEFYTQSGITFDLDEILNAIEK